MPKTHELGRLFIHRFAYSSKHFPLLGRGNTQEITYPFRMGVSWVLRFPTTRHGVVVGWWKEPIDEDKAMSRALSGALIGHKTEYEVRVQDGTVVAEAKAAGSQP